MPAQATIYGVISTLEKYPIEEAKAMLFRMAQDLEVTVTQRAKLEPSSRLDMLTEKEIDRLGDQRMADIKALDIADGLAEGYIDGFKSGLRFARDRFSAPPAIDVEKIMMAVQDSYLAAGVHMGIKSPLAADLRSRLLSLLSPGKGEGVTVAENKAPRS